jgi:DnaD/phage-associated family protein
MPTYRKLHTKILDSYDFSEMPDDFTRVFWMLLPLIVDSEGRGIDNPAWLRSKMFPLRPDVELTDIEQAMTWLDQRGLILRYEVDGRKYFLIVNFKKYQTGTEKEARSVLPAPITPKGDSVPSQELVESKSGVDTEEVGLAASASASVNESVNASASEKAAQVFRVYEREIGPLTPTIADDIKQALVDHPPEWTVAAMEEAARNNKRSWKYCLAILKRWGSDGFQSNNKPAVNGKQSTVTRRGPNGELREFPA